MLNAFLNPWMLAGLAGILLPVIAHLISRKKYDRVEWGAMQFLELDPSAKRKIRLEELLLLLVRMGLIALVAVALARPWIGSDWLGSFASGQPRDLVLIIDGSYSMGWKGKQDGKTPHATSQQLAREFLRDLHPADAIQLIHAREQPDVVFPEMTRDAYRVKEAINELSPPSGSADLASAIRKGVQLLAAGTNLLREVVVFTDSQALSWKADDEPLWARLDDLRTQSPIVPRIWIIDSSNGELGSDPNFAIERPQLSRELAISEIPVRISSKIKMTGGDETAARKLHLEIDERRHDDQTVQIKIPPNGETSVDFEYRFETPGSHLISLVLDEDPLTGDNRADAVVTVTESLPVLLVDGDRKLDPTKSETFFAQAALAAEGDEHPWIKATVITPDELTVDRLKSASVVILANVGRLTDSAITSLKQFSSSGHGVLFTVGDKIDRELYRGSLYEEGQGIFPCQLDRLTTEDGHEKRGVRVATDSLDLPWLQPFRADKGGTLSDARWSQWWKVTIPKDPVNSVAPQSDNRALDPLSTEIKVDGNVTMGTTIVEARLTTGDPLLVSRRFGYGTNAVLTSSLDADWNTLPAKQDYVPFLHELIFSLAIPTLSRNLDVNSPLILSVPSDLKIDEFQFLNPANKTSPAEKVQDSFLRTVTLRDTKLPGIYRFSRKHPKPNDPNRPEYFVVNFDRAESDTTPLTDSQRERLSSDNRLKFVSNLPDLRKNMFTETARTEIWWMLLYLFLGSLAVEAWMTRRMLS